MVALEIIFCPGKSPGKAMEFRHSKLVRTLEEPSVLFQCQASAIVLFVLQMAEHKMASEDKCLIPNITCISSASWSVMPWIFFKFKFWLKIFRKIIAQFSFTSHPVKYLLNLKMVKFTRIQIIASENSKCYWTLELVFECPINFKIVFYIFIKIRHLSY